MENIELYNLILSASKSLNQELLNSCSNHLMLTGTVPEKYQTQLKKINAITGTVFDILLSNDYEYTQEDNIIKIYVEENEFVCLKDQIEFFGQDADSKNISAVRTEVGLLPLSQNPMAEASFAQEELPVTDDAPEEEELILFPIDTDSDLPADDARAVSYPAEDTAAEETAMDFNTFMQLSKKNALGEENNPQDIMDAHMETPARQSMENPGMQDFINLLMDTEAPLDVEESTPQNDAGFLVSKPDVSGAGLNLNEKVLARYTKKKDEFVFISYKIRVMTPGLGNMKEMSVMIAPLAIPEGACPSAPIITSIVCDGRISTKSSYEMEENGKNMLVIRVNNEYEFLVRGFFSSSCTFGGFVATTGKSVERGDKIEVLEEKFYGKADTGTSPAFTINYNEAYDPAQAYILPLINDKKDNFIFFEKTAEFTEYMYYTEDSLGLQKIMITDNGVRKEVVCGWEGDEAVIKFLEVQYEEF